MFVGRASHFILPLIAGGLGLAATVWGAAPTALHAVKVVTINHFRYDPPTLTVRAGDVVEWKNVDMVPHTATTVDGKSFDSGSIATGTSWRFTTVRKGTYEYLCTFHPNMKATLVVK